MSHETVSPIIAAAATLQPSFFASLLTPPSSVLHTNSRPFSLQATLTHNTKETFVVLEKLSSHAAGFLSGKIIGPLRVEVLGTYGSAPTILAGTVGVALHPSGWDPNSLAKIALVADHVVLGLGAMAPIAEATLPFPATFKNNVVVAMPAGLDPKLTVVATLVGYASVTVTISGLIELEGMTQLQPWA